MDMPEPVPNAYQAIELTEAETRMATAGNDFAFRFFQAAESILPSQERGQLFVSPLSASLALSMLDNGAAGTTAAELAEVLGFGGYTLEEINGYNRKLVTELAGLDNTGRLCMANSLWLNEGFRALDAYLAILASDYDAEVQTVDFGKALPAMNAWCKEKTDGLIPKLLDELDTESKLVLMNALYFKGRWTTPFEKEETGKGEFRRADGSVSTVDLMHVEEKFAYVAQDGYAAARFPFGNEAFSLTVILPDVGAALNDCIGDLDAEAWELLQEQLDRTALSLDVKLPKFRVEATHDVKKVLMSMGVRQAFAEGADFSPLSAAPLLLNEVRQAVSFRVDEEGAEAAASTVVGGIAAGGMIEADARPIDFHVQRPFCCVLSEQGTGCILFIGKVEGF